MIRIIITTEPVAKGRSRTTYQNGRVRTYTPQKTLDAQDFMRAKLQRHIKNAFPPHTPIKLTATFYRTKSKWLPKRETMPFRKPDLDNLLNTLMSSLTRILIPDDAQICTIITRKRWSTNSNGHITLKLEPDKL